MVEDAQRARMIVITGGRAGCGCTHVAANLAIALQQQGRRTLLVDLDLGTSNWRKVVGVIPSSSMAHTLNGRTQLEDVILEGPGGITLLRGGIGLGRLDTLTRPQQDSLLRQMAKVDSLFDMVVLDAGVGSHGTLTFVRSADEAIAIATPGKSVILTVRSLNDAYGALKLVGSTRAETRMAICVNFAVSEQQGLEAGMSLVSIARSFLHTHVRYAGTIRRDGALRRAEEQGRPVLLNFPTSAFARDITAIAAGCLRSMSKDRRATVTERLATQLTGPMAAGE
jgi:flagellar biosynthesis protein FlhG